MKNLLLSSFVLFALSGAAVQPAFADGDAQAGTVNVPAEVSAVLVSPQYAAEVAKQVAVVAQGGQFLKITGYGILRTPEATYVTFNLERGVQSGFVSGKPLGELVAQIQYGPQGELIVQGLYFKPIAGIPFEN